MAVPVIIVGDHLLKADSPMQAVEIYVTGGDEVFGLNLYAEIMPVGGGSYTNLGEAPYIQMIDCVAGTIFQSNNKGPSDTDGAGDPDAYPFFEGCELLTLDNPDPPPYGMPQAADGLIATIYINTTGFTDPAQTWKLALSGTVNGNTDFAGAPVDLTDGTIRVPEPMTLGLLGLGGLAVLIRRPRR
jgi:hypothetical protein